MGVGEKSISRYGVSTVRSENKIPFFRAVMGYATNCSHKSEKYAENSIAPLKKIMGA